MNRKQWETFSGETIVSGFLLRRLDFSLIIEPRFFNASLIRDKQTAQFHAFAANLKVAKKEKKKKRENA